MVISWFVIVLFELPLAIILHILNKKEPEWVDKLRLILNLGMYCNYNKVKSGPPNEFVIPQEERQKIAENIIGLEITYTISRASDSYGRDKANLWVHTPYESYKSTSSVRSRCDRAGICLGEWIKNYEPFKPWIIKLSAGHIYGLVFYNTKMRKAHDKYQPGDDIRISGACGFYAMEKILAHLGFYLVKIDEKSKVNSRYYEFKSY